MQVTRAATNHGSKSVSNECRLKTNEYRMFYLSDTVIHYNKKLLFKLMIVPGSYSCLCSETNQLIWTSISSKSTISEDPGICLAGW